MAVHQVNPQGSKLAALDPIWDRMRGEAEEILRREPELASFIYATVLHHERLEDAVVHRIAERLDHAALSGDLIRQIDIPIAALKRRTAFRQISLAPVGRSAADRKSVV